jgi:hypothetical protein
MESAASRPRFFALLPPCDPFAVTRCCAAGTIFGLFAAAAAGLSFTAALCLLLSLWCFHLQSAGVHRAVSLTALALLSAQIHFAPHSLYEAAALGEGLFVYLVVWVLASYQRQPGLQATATAALLLSAGILARPSVAISCAVLSLAFFLVHVRATAHPVGFGLLLFTPAFLCAFGAVAFALLNTGSLLAANAHAHAGPPNPHIWRYLFLLPIAAIVFRVRRRRFGEPDLAYLAMASAGSVLCRLQWPADGISLEDLFFIAAGGAAALVSTYPISRAAQTLYRSRPSPP